jgi:hypothetical protein
MSKPAVQSPASGPTIDEAAAGVALSLQGEAELDAIRLGAAGFDAALATVGKLLDAGRLHPEHPWPIALLGQAVRETARPLGLHPDPPGVSSLAGLRERNRLGLALLAHEALGPLLIPAAAGTFAAAARQDPTGAVEKIGHELEWEATLGGADEFSVVEGDLERARMLRLRSVFERDEQPPSRRRLQRLRQSVAAHEARLDGAKPPPAGKGRRPGAEGKRTAARRADLKAAYLARESDTRTRIASALRSQEARSLVNDHVERHGVSLATAKRDWLEVQRELAGRGQLGYLTQVFTAKTPGEQRAARERVAKIQRRLGSV